MKHDRDTMQKVFIRICSDSKFSLDYVAAAQLAGKILGVHPLEVYGAFPSMSVMVKVSTGEHPASGISRIQVK
jgi:hypothetical protein